MGASGAFAGPELPYAASVQGILEVFLLSRAHPWAPCCENRPVMVVAVSHISELGGGGGEKGVFGLSGLWNGDLR